MEGVTRLKVDELAEGETTQVVGLYDAVEFGILILQAHHAAACEHDLQVGVEVVALAEFRTPVWLFEHLVDEQHAPAALIEIARKLRDAVALEVEVVHVDIQALLVLYIKVLFGILQEEGGLSDAARSLDTDHAITPVDLIHKGASHWCVGMLDKVSVRPEKSFHPERFVLKQLQR